MKVIFIDIDGPLAWDTIHLGKVSLNFGGSIFKIPYPWVEDDCNALSKIIKATEASLVLSSDWRKHYSFFQMRRIFDYYGIGAFSLIDFTTNQSLWKKMSRNTLEWDRASEVIKWAKDNEVSNWIAIDDLDLAHQFKFMQVDEWRHIHVDGEMGEGFRLRDKVDECIEKLNR